MEQGKVVIIGGNKRAGKTTLAMKLHKEYNYNYYNFDMILDALEETFAKLNDGDEQKYLKLLENMVNRSLEDAKNYGVSSVYDYVFEPSGLLELKKNEKLIILFLANLDANEENIRKDMLIFSQPYDWPYYAEKRDIERNVKRILLKNQTLVEECEKYNFRLVNTSRGESRNQILERVCKEIGK